MPPDQDCEESEAELVSRFREGDPSALAAAYARWGRLVHSLALRYLGNYHDAQDVTQQVFVSAWRSRHTLREGTGSLGGWLVTIARRRCADALAVRTRQGRSAAVEVESLAGVGSAVSDDVTDRIVVAHALDALGDPRATIIRLVVIDGHTHEAVAERLDLPLGTVKSHIRRGLLQLRKDLEEVTS
ncbi:MAG TPA: sigma-70 family RNA polymerase sigma factor [Tetrasphaera sp.]|jgi:RNA polymerase sigma factor (sigma-70 family)|uniref:RNA polymerase sigma factor n=1 Tax=Nostocoides sp. TaxID=1917966 RepID=UPI002C21EF97|nr:sigma-70 family RNA polymerase sigma factor [Tetrasphaera sp.]HNQ08588.1 sigma-70 family RNA polymerase sigma factor [Tetrasphaera sp.]